MPDMRGHNVLTKTIRFIASAMIAAVLLGAGPCGGGDKVMSPAIDVASVQIIATPTNPRVGETTILGAIPVNAGGVAVNGVACQMASSDPAILLVTPDGAGWRGRGVAAGIAVVTARCGNIQSVLTITVRPAQVRLTVNRLGDGNGSVFINPPGGTYDSGTTVVITATALAGSTFTGWGGACAGAAATCTLVLNADQTASTTFIVGLPTRIIALTGNLAFGNVTVGQQVQAILTITNNGTGPLTVTGLTGPAGGAYTASWTNGIIPAGGAQQVTVFFRPSAAQSYAGVLTVNGDQTSGVNAIAISGTGTGGPAVGGTAKYDGTYDLTYRVPAPGGVFQTITAQRYVAIRNGTITSTDGAITSGSVDASGVVRFTSVCTINNSTATWTGNMNTTAAAGANAGAGFYSCASPIGGGNSNPWSIAQR